MKEQASDSVSYDCHYSKHSDVLMPRTVHLIKMKYTLEHTVTKSKEMRQMKHTVHIRKIKHKEIVGLHKINYIHTFMYMHISHTAIPVHTCTHIK